MTLISTLHLENKIAEEETPVIRKPSPKGAEKKGKGLFLLTGG